ncbi:MAG: ATP-binding protein [bacterium]
MSRNNWFEISNEGWRRMNAGRRLASLLKEGIQNSFDEDVSEVNVQIGPEEIVVEDDAPQGFAHEKLVYTVFLTDKEDSPTKRGRKGRGLKELISAMESASVETIGSTIHFDDQGRYAVDNGRRRGTRITLRRRSSDEEVEEAVRELSLIIPPKTLALRINQRRVKQPRLHLILWDCLLETVIIRSGVERILERPTRVELYDTRRGETPHLFEMGIPVETLNVPWHVDVQQRLPLADHRESATEHYKMILKSLLLESLIGQWLDRRDLRSEWVDEVLGRQMISDRALEQYVARVFPRGSLLGGAARINDRARQLGGEVVDAGTMPRGVYSALVRVMERAEDYVRRREREFNEQPVEPTPEQARFGLFVRWLGERLLGRRLHVSFVRKEPTLDGLVEDASFDAAEGVMKFNVIGKVDFTNPLSPTTLGILFHELAHNFVTEHDHRFIEHLQNLAGRAAALLAGMDAASIGGLFDGEE